MSLRESECERSRIAVYVGLMIESQVRSGQVRSGQVRPVPGLIESSEGHKGRLSKNSLPVLSMEGPREQFRHGQRRPLFDVIDPAFQDKSV